MSLTAIIYLILFTNFYNYGPFGIIFYLSCLLGSTICEMALQTFVIFIKASLFVGIK